jgi:hypothetical protein
MPRLLAGNSIQNVKAVRIETLDTGNRWMILPSHWAGLTPSAGWIHTDAAFIATNPATPWRRHGFAVQP